MAPPAGGSSSVGSASRRRCATARPRAPSPSGHEVAQLQRLEPHLRLAEPPAYCTPRGKPGSVIHVKTSGGLRLWYNRNLGIALPYDHLPSLRNRRPRPCEDLRMERLPAPGVGPGRVVVDQ